MDRVYLRGLFHFLQLLLLMVEILLGCIAYNTQSSAEIELFGVQRELWTLVLLDRIWCRDYNSLWQEHDLLIFLIQGLLWVLKWTHEWRLRYFAAGLIWTIRLPFFFLLTPRIPLVWGRLSLTRYLWKLHNWVITVFFNQWKNIAFLRRGYWRDERSTLRLCILTQSTARNVLQLLSADLGHLLLLSLLESAVFELYLVYHEQVLSLILWVV